MFASKNKGAPLKLIDFGSGTMDSDEEVIEESAPTTCEQADGNILRQFTTFAGSAFYISPEMFQRKYTCKTDVWSAGVTIFVLVAGYPSMALQAAFNLLQKHKEPGTLLKLEFTFLIIVSIHVHRHLTNFSSSSCQKIELSNSSSYLICQKCLMISLTC